jgi:hypothetical protein
MYLKQVLENEAVNSVFRISYKAPFVCYRLICGKPKVGENCVSVVVSKVK